MKRLFDILFALLLLMLLTPLWLGISMTVALSGKGSIFFKQVRVGKCGILFSLYKFRSMRPGSESQGQLTVGGKDPRITRAGFFLRKYKLDELPQLLNILKGEMSFVGPRPEVPKYVSMYTPEQREVLRIRPGLTDYASIEYFDENEILGRAEHPEKEYLETIMPEKLRLNRDYLNQSNLGTDLHIIYKTLLRFFRKNS